MAKDMKQEVTRQDQEHINSFNKLNAKMHELEGKVKAKKKLLEDLEDAGNELMLSDEDSVRYVLGECFVHMDKEDAEGKLEELASSAGAEVKALEAEGQQLQAQMKELKAILYGKFGASINLEE